MYLWNEFLYPQKSWNFFDFLSCLNRGLKSSLCKMYHSIRFIIHYRFCFVPIKRNACQVRALPFLFKHNMFRQCSQLLGVVWAWLVRSRRRNKSKFLRIFRREPSKYSNLTLNLNCCCVYDWSNWKERWFIRNQKSVSQAFHAMAPWQKLRSRSRREISTCKPNHKIRIQYCGLFYILCNPRS